MITAGDQLPITATCIANHERRAMALLERARQARRSLVITDAVDHYRRILLVESHAVGRWLVLEPWSDFQERALRSAELKGSVYDLVVLPASLAWNAALARVLVAWSPHSVLIDAGRATAGSYDRKLWVGALLARIRALFPDVPISLFCSPLSLPSRTLLDTVAADQIEPASRLVDPAPFLWLQHVTDEGSRLPALRAALAGKEARAVVVASTRRTAARIVDALGHDGHTPALYHGGLGSAEKALALAAYRESHSPVLAGTEALLVEPEVSAPDLIIASHPPRWPELAVALLAWGKPETAVVFLYTTSDLAALEARVLADLPSLDRVRIVYRALRANARRGYVLVNPRSLGKSLGGVFAAHPSLVHGALLLLERHGFVHRQEDFPRAGSLTLEGTPGGVLGAIAGAARLTAGIPTPIEPLQLAHRVGLSPDALQRALLDADTQGTAVLRAVALDMLYVLPTPPDRAGYHLSAAIRRLEERARWSSHLVAGFLTASGCRLGALQGMYGLPAGPRCGRCDVCRGVSRGEDGPSASPDSATYLALRALAAIPLGIPRATALRVVRGALASGGRVADEHAAAVLLDDLVQRRLLAGRPGSLVELLQVSEQGIRALALHQV